MEIPDVYSEIQKQDRDIFNLTMYEKKIQKCIVQNQKQITTDLPAVFDELLQSAHGDFSYIKKSFINLVVLTYRFCRKLY